MRSVCGKGATFNIPPLLPQDILKCTPENMSCEVLTTLVPTHGCLGSDAKPGPSHLQPSIVSSQPERCRLLGPFDPGTPYGGIPVHHTAASGMSSTMPHTTSSCTRVRMYAARKSAKHCLKSLETSVLLSHSLAIFHKTNSTENVKKHTQHTRRE